jgi:hypothetical protein
MINKNILLVFVLSLFIISLSSASLGIFKQNTCVDIRVLANCTTVNLVEVNDGSTTYIINSAMTNLGGQTFNYSFCNTSKLGTYSYSWDNTCVDCATDNCGNSFQVTTNGNPKAEGILIVVFTIIFIAIFFFGLLYFMKVLGNVLRIDMDIIDLTVLIGTYLSMWIFYYFSWEYLGNAFINNILETAIMIGAFTHVFLPIVGFMISFILTNLKAKQKAQITY